MDHLADILTPVDPELYSGPLRSSSLYMRDVITVEPYRHPIDSRAIVFIGFPSDDGVRRNDGRCGAGEAPDRIRRQLSALSAPMTLGQGRHERVLRDLGNVQCSGDLEQDQRTLGSVVGTALAAGSFPIVLGGGHETAFGHFLGYVKSCRSVRILNLDAHLDVRPLKEGRGHSGSPFRQAQEHESGLLVPRGYLCVGIQDQSNGRQAFDFMSKHKFGWVSLNEFNTAQGQQTIATFLRRKRGKLMLTIDMDGIRQSDSPGVSAPSPIGLSARQAVSLVRQVASSNISSVEIVECNPSYDHDDQTCRLAALLVWEIVRKLYSRDASHAYKY